MVASGGETERRASTMRGPALLLAAMVAMAGVQWGYEGAGGGGGGGLFLS